MKPTFQAIIYSVQRSYYHGMELPPGGIKEADIPADVNTRKETLYGYVIGAYGSESIFPKGYENFKILDISDFVPLEKALKWVANAKKRLNLSHEPKELSDLTTDNMAA